MGRTILHVFRRDLRLTDNASLHEASQQADCVVPVFVVDPGILGRADIGAPIVGFFMESLEALAKNLEHAGSRLIVRTGDPIREIRRLVKETQADAVYFNRDYEPHARDRDRRIEEAGRQHGFEVRTFKDMVLHEGDELFTTSGTPYTVFTPYSKKWRSLEKDSVRPRFKAKQAPPAALRSDPIPTPASLGFQPGAGTVPAAGEKEGLRLLETFLDGPIDRYAEQRDVPSIEGTSRLSPHLRAGTISVRTVLHRALQRRASVRSKAAAGIDTYIGELAWRDFYQQILWHFPHVVDTSFRPEFERLAWSDNDDHFAAWCAGRTGYPIVDAAMRQLRETGWMHNRLRMVVAMFLTKDLLINWQKGERFFMQHLADCECAANNGGWQWSASTGTDAAPYFRIFSPVSQSKKYDPDGTFIRRFVPELRSLNNAEIHAPAESVALQLKGLGYPVPLVDHSVQRQKALALYKGA